MADILDIVKKIKERRMRCPDCKGEGRKFKTRPAPSGTLGNYTIDTCWTCGGTGKKSEDGKNIFGF